MRVFYYGLLAAAALLLLYGVVVLFAVAIVGFLLAYFLEPVVNTLESRGAHRVLSTLALFGILAAMLVALFLWLYPVVADQLMALARDLPDYRAFLAGLIDGARARVLSRIPQGILGDFEALFSFQFRDGMGGAVLSLPALASGAFSTLTVAVFSPVVAFFFLVQGAEIKRNLVSLIPNRYFEMTLMLIHRIDRQVGAYLRGTLLDCMAVAVLAVAALSLLRVPNAVAIGLFAGVANAIPYVGPIAGALPAMLVVILAEDPFAPWWTVPLAFAAIKLFEDLFIYPLTVGRSLRLHPLAVILGILVGQHLAGFLGMLLAAPFMAIGKTVIEVLRSSLKSYRVI